MCTRSNSDLFYTFNDGRHDDSERRLIDGEGKQPAVILDTLASISMMNDNGRSLSSSKNEEAHHHQNEAVLQLCLAQIKQQPPVVAPQPVPPRRAKRNEPNTTTYRITTTAAAVYGIISIRNESSQERFHLPNHRRRKSWECGVLFSHRRSVLKRSSKRSCYARHFPALSSLF